MKKRILSLVLAVSLCTSLLVAPAYATPALPGEVSIPAQSALGVSDVKSLVNSLNRAIDQIIADSTLVAGSYWTTNPPIGYVYCTYDSMCSFASVLNTQYNDNNWFFYVTKLPDSDFHAIRLLRMSINKNPTEALWYLADHDGYMLVSMPGDGVPDAPTTPSTIVQAIPRSQAASVGAYRMVAYEDLYNLAYDYNAQHNYKLAVNTDGIYWAISSRGEYVLANESGLPYGAVGPSSVTSGGSRPDVTTNEDHIIDWLNNTVGSNDGVYGFDNVLYDSNNKTYYVDNSVSYQNSFNEYYYYNWSYTYNIDYTNITYIGASAEYTESYECYYTLPDGRSSADLTKEDLEQLNLSMDVVSYQRSADDTRLRSLYHFDGNTEDSSFWNYQTSFDWTEGASLTYLESNAFNGCLYLDELAHDFTVTLPSSLGSGDFTVDFRYYQSSTLAPQNDSYISIGGQEVLRLTGSNFTFNGTNYATPVGSWNHLAFVRKDGTLYFYLNGVRQGSKAFSNALSSAVQFSFGSSQQTYKYFDELRVTNFAVWESAFTPATVPYDTNLSLVLPTDTVPVADEYWNITCDNNLLSQYNLDWWDNSHLLDTSRLHSGNYFTSTVNRDNWAWGRLPYYSPSYASRTGDFTSLVSSNSVFPSFIYSSSITSLSVFDSGCVISSPSCIPPSYVYCFGIDGYSYNNHSIVSGLGSFVYSSNPSLGLSYLCSPGTPFTFTAVGSDGSISSFTFSVPTSGSARVVSSMDFCGYRFGLYYENSNYDYFHSLNQAYTYSTAFLFVYPLSSNPSSFVYLALEEGTESTVTAEFVSGVAGIPVDDLNTPTLAVRSDIAINNKQIGGVRPSFAQRGDVYAMVESGFITSLQQYTGYAWQAVDGRIWTGSRWIPYSSYNVITLSDMYDIADASGQGGYEYIYSQSGFWSWWQKQWLEFKQWYSSLSFTGDSGGDTNINVPIIAPDIDAEWDFSDDEMNFVDYLTLLPKTGYSMVNGLIKTVGNTLKNVPLALNTFVVQGNPLNPAGAFKVFIIPGT